MGRASFLRRRISALISDIFDDFAYMSRNHEIFIGGDDPDGGRAAVWGDDGGVDPVAFGVDVNAEEAQAGADALAHRGGVLPHTAGENESVQASRTAARAPRDLRAV